MAHDASDPKAVNKREKKREDERLQELEDIKFLLKHKPGQRFIKRLFDEGMIFRTTFTGNSQGFFLEGHRNLALVFFHDVVEAAPERIPDLMLTPEPLEDMPAAGEKEE